MGALLKSLTPDAASIKVKIPLKNHSTPLAIRGAIVFLQADDVGPCAPVLQYKRRLCADSQAS